MAGTSISDIPVSANLSIAPSKQSAAKNDDKGKDFMEMMANSMPDMSMPVSGISNYVYAGRDNSSKTDYSDFKVSDSNKFNRIDEANDTKVDNSIPDDDLEKIKDAVCNFENEVKEVIVDNLDVSEEDITEAMEVLGLSFIDLTDPSNLSKLVSYLSGNEDSVNLLTSSSFSNISQEVSGLVNDFMESTGLKVEQLSEVMDALKVALESGMEILDEPIKLEGAIEEMPLATEDKSAIVGNTKPTDITIDAKETNASVGDIKESDKSVDEPQIQTESKQQNAQKDTNGSMNQSGQNNSSFTQADTTNMNMNVNASNASNHIQNVNVESTVDATPIDSYVSVDTQNVIEQIVNAARTSITATVRSMEMELNPLNLGRMLMQVTEQDGQITAKLLLQNEAVKEAMESQLNVLKEQLNEQGIKVEAVEVSVGTHEFEQNLEEGQQNLMQEQLQREQEEQTRKERLRRGINLDDEEMMVDADLTEEEQLTAKIMKDEGNTVNFRA